MEITKAIEILKVREQFVADIDIDAKIAYKMAIEALEKQITKAPIKEKWLPTECPTCGCSLSKSLGDGYYEDIETEICNCGQRLDWC